MAFQQQWRRALLCVLVSLCACLVLCFSGYSPPDRKGLLFAMLLHHAPQPSILPEQLASGSRRVSRQSSSPVDPAKYPTRDARQRIPPSIPPELLASGSRQVPARAARQWIPPSIPPELLAGGSPRVSRQNGSPGHPTEYPARAARQWRLASGSRRVSRQSSWPVDPAQYPAKPARRWIPPSIPPERLASESRQVSRQSSWPVNPAQYPARAARSRRVSRQSGSPVDRTRMECTCFPAVCAPIMNVPTRLRERLSKRRLLPGF